MTQDVSGPRLRRAARLSEKKRSAPIGLRQWGEFDPLVEPLAMTARKTEARPASGCTQLVKSLQGDVLSDSEVLHVLTVNSGLIAAMDLGDEADPTAGPSAAFAHRS